MPDEKKILEENCSFGNMKRGRIILTDFTFKPTSEKADISTTLDEIYRSMGIPQYMKEIEKNKFLEKILSKDK